MSGSGRADRRLDPELVTEAWTPTRGEQQLRVPVDLACWPGHFPDLPVVPGVLQLDWVLRAAARWIGHHPALTRIEELKFKSLMRPSQDFRLALEWNPRRRLLRFQLSDGDTIFSQGRLELTAPEGS